MDRLVRAPAAPLAYPGKTVASVGKQELGRGFGVPAAMADAQQEGAQDGQAVDTSAGILDDGTDVSGDTQQNSPYDSANIAKNIDAIRQQGGTEKDIAAYLSNAKAYQEMVATQGTGGKPISATAADAIANAQSALSSIDTIEQQLAADPSVQTRGAASAIANPFGITSRLAGTGQYDAALSNAKDVIARLRTGAAISNSEEKRFTAMLPQPADSQAVVQQKLSLLKNALNTIVNRVGGNSDDLLQEAAQAAQ